MQNTILELTGVPKSKYLASLISLLRLAETIAEKSDINDHGQMQEVLELLQFLQGDENFSPYNAIKIECSRSGFPHLSQVTEVLLDKKYAGSFLQKLPSLERCVQRCIGQLHSGSSAGSNDFTRLQEQVRKIRFYSALQSQRLPSLAECFLESAEKMEEFHAHTVVYKGYDTAKMRFLSYSLLLFQRRNSPYLQPVPAGITPLLRERISKDVGLSTAEMFYNLNQQPHFAVVSVERLVLGPFYTRDTYLDQECGGSINDTRGNTYGGTYSEPASAALAAIFSSAVSELSAASGAKSLDMEIPNTEILPSVLELEQQISEDEDTFLTQDIQGALHQQHKQAYRPNVKYRRHFICSSQALFEELSRHISSDRYLARVYCMQPETEKQEIEKKLQS